MVEKLDWEKQFNKTKISCKHETPIKTSRIRKEKPIVITVVYFLLLILWIYLFVFDDLCFPGFVISGSEDLVQDEDEVDHWQEEQVHKEPVDLEVFLSKIIFKTFIFITLTWKLYNLAYSL